MAVKYVLYALKLKRSLRRNPVSKSFYYAKRTHCLTAIALLLDIVFVMIKYVLCLRQFNHKYVEP